MSVTYESGMVGWGVGGGEDFLEEVLPFPTILRGLYSYKNFQEL